jgi:hypothetical protein
MSGIALDLEAQLAGREKMFHSPVEKLFIFSADIVLLYIGKPIMHFDDLYQYTGQIGVYQVCAAIILLSLNLYSLDSMTMIFVGADMPHWCRIDELVHLPFEKQKYIGIPYDDGSPSEGGSTYSSCKMFALNYSAFSNDELTTWNRTLLISDRTPVTDCTQWIYDQTTFVSTIVSRVRYVT